MFKRVFIVTLFFLVCFAGIASAQKEKKRQWEYPPKLPNAKAEVYKRVLNEDLNVYVYYPKDHQTTDRRSAIIFFFGGGWVGGTPEQFAPHCEYLAARGMVAITADYRVAMRQSTKPVCCVADAKSAVRWLRQNADSMGVDPSKIVASGGSAGGHIAACAGIAPEMDEPQENAEISSRPNALALFNPVLQVGPTDGFGDDKEFEAKLADRFGIASEQISPFHQITEGLPPTIIFHGTHDKTVSIESVRSFTTGMTVAGNRCKLCEYEGQQHGFFNQGRNKDRFFNLTLSELDDFLVSLKYLEAPKNEQ